MGAKNVSSRFFLLEGTAHAINPFEKEIHPTDKATVEVGGEAV